MKSKISALMDGELDGREAAGALESLRSEGEARETWRTYHLIGDAMHDAHRLSGGFAIRLAARLAAEPTVLAPRRSVGRVLEQHRWQVLSAAASLAAVAFVSVTFFSQEPAAPEPPVAAAGGGAQQVELVQVAPPEAANDYLLAHQTYSPRMPLQGIAPYVRTVSSDSSGPQR
ncbi:MAG TPA: sigma-E factor negative regulatory protein [Burkholderiales bacterium]|nr:sigma-E factor negative regulatory protein [Burkholderiales bacterium]